jgi:two-component system, NarL family, sensor histidine kinase UhpB
VTTAHPERLLAADSPFRMIAERAPMMLWVTGADARCLMLNQGWRFFRGLRLADEVPAGWSHGIHPDDRDAAVALFVAAHQSPQAYTADYRVLRADGQYRWVHDHAEPWFDDERRFMGHVGCCVDITDQRTPPPELASAERRLKQLVETSRDLVYRVRLFPSLAVEYMGGAVETITGHTATEWYDNPYLIRTAVHPDDLPIIAMRPDQAARLPAATTLRWIHPGGRVVWADHYRMPIFDAAGQIVGLEGLARDVTQRVESERQLRESEERLRQLAARVQTAREEERAEVSRELHDQLGQTLTALKLEVNRAAAAFASERSDVTTVDRLQPVVELADLAIGMVKRISARLRPATLDHLGLAEAIKWEAVTFKQRTGIRCSVRANRRQTRLTPDQQTALFRIVQEALNNVVCHANASSVHVSMRETDTDVELKVRDNGRGISTAQTAAPGSLGLLGMKERAALIGGTVNIAGQRGKGTLVSVHVPVNGVAGADGPRRETEPRIG